MVLADIADTADESVAAGGPTTAIVVHLRLNVLILNAVQQWREDAPCLIQLIAAYKVRSITL